jgi:hypothetical protein
MAPRMVDGHQIFLGYRNIFSWGLHIITKNDIKKSRESRERQIDTVSLLAPRLGRPSVRKITLEREDP